LVYIVWEEVTQNVSPIGLGAESNQVATKHVGSCESPWV
jgi:hypothetical protein